MLKKICGLFLGLIVCTGSACVTPTHASSAAQVVLTRIQASGTMGAKDELLVFHNNSSLEVEITGWCIGNKSAVLFACFNSVREDIVERYFIPPYGDVTVASETYIAGSALSRDSFSWVYEVTNQSSGSIVNGGDTISIIDLSGDAVDAKTWTAAVPANKILSRIKIMSGPDIYATNNETLDWTIEARSLPPESSLITRQEPIEIPEDPENPDSNGGEIPPTVTPLPPVITELFPNPAGSDTGGEFIELYNPNEDALLLDGFTLQIGIDSVKTYPFPLNATIPPLGYKVFYNHEIDFTLVNTTGRVQLFSEGTATGESVDYVNPKDEYVWALIDDVWQYTKSKTPGAMNVLGLLEEAISDELSDVSIPKPCAANQYRNPATGRCKLLTMDTSTPAPCKVGQTRNSETNRCRGVTAATKMPTPCKEGQERNPETNRCRGVTKMSNVGHGVLGVQSKADTVMQWYYWATIVLVVGLIVAYGVWEWRHELLAAWGRLKEKFTRRSN